jgi:hypothetical protein
MVDPSRKEPDGWARPRLTESNRQISGVRVTTCSFSVMLKCRARELSQDDPTQPPMIFPQAAGQNDRRM